jgi:hypothetical protein
VRPRSRWLVIVLTVVVVGGLAAAAVAFGGGDGGNNSSTGSGANGTSSGATSSPSPNATDNGPCTMDPSFDYGQVICITAKGLRPNWLVSLQGKPITWRNQTSRPVSITLVAFPVKSGPIPPDGTWSYTPTLPLSFAYHVSSTERLGRIQVLAPES